MGSNDQFDLDTFTETEVATFSTQVTEEKQKYTKVDHALAVRMRVKDKLTYNEIGARLGTTGPYIAKVVGKFLDLLENPGSLYAYQENKPDLLEAMELKLLTYLNDLLKDNKKASVKDISLALKVVSELVRLNKGQSTSNVSVLLKSIEEAHQDPLSTGNTCPEKSSSSGSLEPMESPKALPSTVMDSPDLTVTPPLNDSTK